MGFGVVCSGDLIIIPMKILQLSEGETEINQYEANLWSTLMCQFQGIYNKIFVCYISAILGKAQVDPQ